MGRKRSRRQGDPQEPLQLPPSVRENLGDEADLLLEALKSPAPVSIRLNPLKEASMEGSPVPWCSSGRYLEERPVFTLDPLLHAGAYYVQEASSMLLEQAFKACSALPTDAVVLDLCAAPGGKSTHLAALLQDQAILIANEPVRARQAALMENLWKWGRPDTIVTGSLPEHFRSLGAFCDLVLVDAPCSGEGMFRKDPFARAQWSAQLVETCAVRQQGILDAAWDALRPGGYLIYSTCTWEARENEDQMERLVQRGAEPVTIPVQQEWGVKHSDRGLRCYPHCVRGEGFFISVLRKPSSIPGTDQLPSDGERMRSDAPEFLPMLNWLNDPERFTLKEQDGIQLAFSKRWTKLLNALTTCVRVIAPGIPVAQRKGEAWVPHPALGLSISLDQQAFPAMDLDRELALQYLRGGILPATEAKGPVLVRFQDLGLGWANGAGTRWNNGWPAPWRIRMR